MLNFSGKKSIPVIYQTESTECGLACIAMLSSYHGYKIDLSSLRKSHSISSRGSTLTELISISQKMNLIARPVKASLEGLSQLSLPAILHWDFNHFVVLKKVNNISAVIIDPALGEKKIALNELSKHYTGVALEVSTSSNFEVGEEQQNLRIKTLIGSMPGWVSAVTKILLLALALEVFVLTSPFYIQLVVDQAVLSTDSDLLLVLALGFSLLLMVQVSIKFFRSWALMILSTHLNLQLYNNLFRRLIRLPMNYFHKRHLGDVVSRFSSLDVLQSTLTNQFLEAIIDGIMVIAVLTVMIIYSPMLTAVVCGFALIYGVYRFAFYYPLRNATNDKITYQAKQDTHFYESVRGMQSIKLFSNENTRHSQFHNLMIDNFNAGIKINKLNIYYNLVNGSLFGVEQIIVVWLAAQLIISQDFTIGMLFAFMAYKTQFSTRIIGLIEKGIEFKMLTLHKQRIADIALTEPELDNVTPINSKPKTDIEIELRNVCYQYAESEPMILNDVNLSIHKGESVAIAGPSGCGKTTLVKIMLGLIKPTSGEVYIRGCALSKTSIEEYRSLIASVMQDDHLFAGSLTDNISFFDAAVDMQRVQKVAALAAIDDEITNMPMAYNSLISDMGSALSGGQKQRILLARALYKKPAILFLDEATSHLDIEREFTVNEAIKSLAITRVIIAHRKETLNSADRLIYIENNGFFSEQNQASLSVYHA